ncbi:MAG TPA: amino acid permease [Candidatus Marinimicrobia bacterium]|nr:amino acid permease [Candidatus Neomarinimicrobiota bacterium]
MIEKSTSNRHISMWTASSFVIASMIGTGVFTSLGFQLNDIQSIFPLIMLWIVGGVVALCGALSYSELGAALPRSGGEYHLLSRIIHPSIGFAGGFVSATVGFSAPAVLAAMALGTYFAAIFPAFDPMWVACSMILVFHFLHAFSLKWGTLFQGWSTGIKVILIFIFIIAGFMMNDHQVISILPKPGDVKLIMSSGFAVSLVWVYYAYTGWNSTIYFAGEVRNPQKDLPRSLLLGTSFVMVLYVLLNYIFLYTTPMSEMVGQVEVGYISGVRIFGQTGAGIIAIGISFLLLSTISSYVFIGPRIMETMGEDYSYIRILSKNNSQGIPIYAFILQLAICLLFIFTSSFEQVLMYTGIALIITNSATVAAVFVLRKREPELPRPYKVWGYPGTPILFLAVNAWILFYTFKEQTVESIIGVSLFLASILLYYLGKKFEQNTQI